MIGKQRRWAVCAALGCFLVSGTASSLAQTAKVGNASKPGQPTGNKSAAPVGDGGSGGPAPRGVGNDSCATPQAISGLGPFVFDNLNATTGAEGQDNAACASNGTLAILNDEWFCWTAGCTGMITISTCGQTQADTKIAVYDGCGCPLTPGNAICCSDDNCGVQTIVRCDVQCGHMYLIQIGNAPNAAIPPGSGTFTIDCAGEPCGGDQGPQPECCGLKPQYADPAYGSFTGQVMAMTAETFFPPNNSLYALTVFDLKNFAAAPLDMNWNPANFRYNNAAWTRGNLGSLFGITLDDRGNLYTAHTSIYNGNDPVGTLAGSTTGTIYKIASGTGAPTVFANLPNSGPGVGNLSWDCRHDQIFASNFEDGRIYRIRSDGTFLSAYDHATNTLTPAVAGVIANEAGEPDGAYATLGERVWAVRHLGDRLYYSLWNHDSRSVNDAANPLPPNQIWSIRLDAAGEFIPGTQVLEKNMPPYPGYLKSQPVSDISFSQDSPVKMLVAERNMTTDSSSYAHDARLIEMDWVAGNWVPSAGNSNANGTAYGFSVGDYGVQTNSAGGADYDTEPNGRIWVSGDAMHFNGPVDYIYGGAGVLRLGSSPSNHILFDYNNDTTNVDKSQLGDVVIPCFQAPCVDFTNVVIRCHIGPDGLPDGTYTVTYTITNNSGVTVHYVLLPNAPTSPHVIVLPTPLPNGASTTVTTTLTGVAPGSTYCFDVILADANVRECCHAQLCVDVPLCDCIQFNDVSVVCDPATGQVTLQLTWQNLRPEILSHMFLIAQTPAGVVFSPDYLPLPNVPPGGVFTTPQITISGANPGDQVCLLITVHNQALVQCCAVQLCFIMPQPCLVACPGDFNLDGVVNSQDYFDFLVAFFAGDPAADVNHNGVVNSQDYFDFLVAFFEGCP
ncbi:MAG: GC-type dockerin domain-anchored protein [Phycisphaerales bacterium]